jgi:hypothetical protein
MNVLKKISGYAWAIACFLIVPAVFIGNHYFSTRLASATGIIVSPWYSGGEVIKTIERTTYRTIIHRPVFDGLIGKRENGFIQVEWMPVTELPPVIEDKIDFTDDGRGNFTFKLDTATGEGSLTAHSPSVISLDRIVRVKNGWVARINLRNIS